MDRLRVAQIIFAILGAIVIAGVAVRACGDGGDDGPRLRRIDVPAQVDPELRDDVGRDDLGTVPPGGGSEPSTAD